MSKVFKEKKNVRHGRLSCMPFGVTNRRSFNPYQRKNAWSNYNEAPYKKQTLVQAQRIHTSFRCRPSWSTQQTAPLRPPRRMEFSPMLAVDTTCQGAAPASCFAHCRSTSVAPRFRAGTQKAPRGAL